MAAWNDYNDADEQQDFDVIPKGTVARVRLTIKPGGFDDPSQGWVGGYATRGADTGSVYLACEFVLLDGEYARRKLFSNIGLYSPRGPTWGQMGRSFVRAILNSARGIDPKDASPEAVEARRIRSFKELDGIEFIGRIDVEKDARGDLRNLVRYAIEPGQAGYAQAPGPAAAPRSDTATPAAARIEPAADKPGWAQ